MTNINNRHSMPLFSKCQQIVALSPSIRNSNSYLERLANRCFTAYSLSANLNVYIHVYDYLIKYTFYISLCYSNNFFMFENMVKYLY